MTADSREQTLLVTDFHSDVPTAASPSFDSVVETARSETPEEPWRLAPCPVPWRHPVRFTRWAAGTGLDVVSLWVILSLLAAIPIVNFYVLGYLLEIEGRIARTGKLRDALPLAFHARRITVLFAGTAICLAPISLLAGARADARLIDPQGQPAAVFAVLVPALALLVGLHLCLALARGGSFGCFVRPIKNIRWLIAQFQSGNYWSDAGQELESFLADLRLRHHFWLGLRGFAMTLLWLLIPSLLFAGLRTTDKPLQIIGVLVGGVVMTPILVWLPFLQARLASTNSFRESFRVRAIRELFRHAPIAWTIATIVLFTLALPLNLFKIKVLPDDARWLITPIFIATITPARVLIGWAYHRASQRESGWFGWRWLSRTVLVPAVMFYVFLLYFTPFISEHGRRVLFEHHAFALPVPF